MRSQIPIPLLIACSLALQAASALAQEAPASSVNAGKWIAEMVASPDVKWAGEKWSPANGDAKWNSDALALPTANLSVWKKADEKAPLTWAEVSPDGSLVVSVDGASEIRVWDVAEKTLLATLNGSDELKSWLADHMADRNVNWAESADWKAWTDAAVQNQGLIRNWAAVQVSL